MPWEWNLPRGILYRVTDSATLVSLARGYSGHPPHVNDPLAQNIADVGPIPVGKYTILSPRDTDKHGPYVLPLQPAPTNEMHGRAGFLIHGDSSDHPGAASMGCIILPLAARQKIWESNDHELAVTV